MSIQRYDFYDDSRHCTNYKDRVAIKTGDFVLFTDHLAKIERLMTKVEEKQDKIERLMAERDEMRNARDVLRQVAEKTEGLRREVEAGRDAAERERGEAMEALRFYANNDTLVIMQDGGQQASAALAKIEGGTNGR